MTCDNTAYCWDFNEQGYCKTCGAVREPEPRFIEPALLSRPVRWPTGTWFQERRAKLLRDEAERIDKTDWR